jgi:hypothetical protein
MKKVLILAYDFPPYVSVGGIRPWNWYTYLKEFGVEPIVITRQWSNLYGNHLDYIAPGYSEKTIIEESEFGLIYRTPYKPNLANRIMLKYGEKKFRFLRKMISAWFEITQFLWISGPKKILYKEARKYLKSNKVDAILATGDPFVLFSFASKLSKEFETKWLADYRDPWSLGLVTEKKPIIRWWSSFFEKHYVKNANSIITVDELFKNKISSYFPQKEFFILPNGFNPKALEDLEHIKPSQDELTIAHAGTIYNWQPTYQFIDEFAAFITAQPNARIRLIFYGVNASEEVYNYLKEKYPHVLKHFTVYPRIPNTELFEKLAANHIMLLFSCYAYSGTKIYDYLAVQRQILFCFTDDANANALKDQYYFKETEEEQLLRPQIDIINRTNSGILIKDQSDLKFQLEKLYSEFEYTGLVACNSQNVEDYSRKIQVKKLAAIIKNL